MDRVRLKNIIILILALVNCFLLLSLGVRRSQASSARRRTADELTRLFAADGIALDGSAVPADVPSSGGTLSRSPEADAALAAFFLGDELQTQDEGGGITTYTARSGRATFRSGGGFDITGTLAGDTEAESVCRRFCRTFGYRELDVKIAAGSGAATAVRYVNGCPVVNASVTLQAQGGVLVSVSGTHLPDNLVAGSGGAMTAATALTRFLEARQQIGYIVSSVTDVRLCLQLQSSAAAAMSLVPLWRLETDGGNYDVNSYTGAVTRG